jgi:hypothetical protein
MVENDAVNLVDLFGMYAFSGPFGDFDKMLEELAKKSSRSTLKEKAEFCGMVCCAVDTGKAYYTFAKGGFRICLAHLAKCRDGDIEVFPWHTQPQGMVRFSDGDRDISGGHITSDGTVGRRPMPFLLIVVIDAGGGAGGGVKEGTKIRIRVTGPNKGSERDMRDIEVDPDDEFWEDVVDKGWQEDRDEAEKKKKQREDFRKRMDERKERKGR